MAGAAENLFYVTGGTLRADALSYVERQADKDLLDGLLKGEFCYVLTSRQMGKSSLMVRTAKKLCAQGGHVAALDLTALGQNLTPEQWYDGLLALTGRQLRLEDELEDFWREHERLGPVQRLFSALREVALVKLPGPLIMFVDEIDAVRSLPFSTDEFFAAIRECFNRRGGDAEFQRLCFCLLGVATPSDLIRDTRTTPFNIGHRIELKDFTPQEAAPLAQGLGSEERRSIRLLKRILHWTGGHPYLTQRLCRAVAEANVPGSQLQSIVRPPQVDALCTHLFLTERAREQDDNLLFVRERILRTEGDRMALLDVYAQIFRSRRGMRDDASSSLVDLLRLSGVVGIRGGRLHVRNRIYRHVFDRDWIHSNMPDAELLRQRAAYRRGVLRTASVAAAMIAIMSVLILLAWYQRNETRTQLGRLYVEKGMDLMDARDYGSALPWLAEAMDMDSGNPERVAMHRYRLAEALENSPTLLHIWFHELGINEAAFSPDGRRVMTVGYDNSAQIWDAVSGKPASPPLDHGTEAIFHAVFAPDGQRALTFGTRVRLWNTANGQFGQIIPQLTAQLGPVKYATLSQDGRWILVLTTGVAQVWDAATGQAVSPPMNHEGIQKGSFSPDGRRILTTGTDATVQIWDIATGKLEVSPLKVPHLLEAVFSPEGQRVATATAGTFGGRVWEISSGQAVTPPFQHAHRISDIAFSPDGSRVLTASWDKTARVWDAQTGRPVTEFLMHRGRVTLAKFSPDGQRIATASSDGTARVWDATTGQAVTPPLRHSGDVKHAAFSPDGRRLVTTSSSFNKKYSEARLWDLGPRPQAPLSLHRGSNVVDISFSPDGSHVVTASHDHTARIWNVNTGQPLAPPLQHGGPVTSASFDPRGLRVVTSSWDRTIRIWNATNGEALVEPVHLSNWVQQAVFSQNSQRLLTYGMGPAQVWTAPYGQSLRPLFTFISSSEFAALSPDGRLGVFPLTRLTLGKRALNYASGAIHDLQNGGRINPNQGTFLDNMAVVANQMRTGEWIYEAPVHSDSILHVQFSPDGRHIVTASADRTARIWSVSSMRFKPPMEHGADVRYAEFSPDGTKVATASEDQTARIWSAKTGLPLTPAMKHAAEVERASFSPDGRLVITASLDRTSKVWDTATGEPVSSALRFPGPVRRAKFSPDNKRMAAASDGDGSAPGEARVWELPRTDLSTHAIILAARLISGYRVDNAAGLVPLDSKAVRTLWQEFQSIRPRGAPDNESLR